MIRWYRYAKTSPGPTWVRRSRLQHVTPGGQVVWQSYIWRRSLLRMALAWLAACGLFAFIAWGLVR